MNGIGGLVSSQQYIFLAFNFAIPSGKGINYLLSKHGNVVLSLSPFTLWPGDHIYYVGVICKERCHILGMSAADM